MNFKNRKWKRTLSVVLSLLLIVSTLAIGNVASVKASADSDKTGKTIYIRLKEYSGDSNHPEYGVWTWGSSGGSKYYRLTNVQKSKEYFQFTPDGDFSNFKILKIGDGAEDPDYTTIDRVTNFDDIAVGYSKNDIKQSEEYSAGGYSDEKCVFEQSSKEWKSKYNSDYNWIDFPKEITLGNYGGNEYDAGVGYYDPSTGKYTADGVDLYPVKATFYDYLTDYELQNGWREHHGDFTASRTYLNRIPYTEFNSYISNLTGGENGNWQYPLYFGNITSDWGDNAGSSSEPFKSIPYGTLIDKHIYGANATNMANYLGNTTKGHLRHDDQISNYTAGKKLFNFSIYTNDSEGVRYTNNVRTYSGSVQGLVKDRLQGNQLMMTTKETDLVSPYFSSNIYNNSVSTKFPMRINSTNPVSGTDATYTTYEFNSNGKDQTKEAVSDIAYFTYDSNGLPIALNYTNKWQKQVIDAYKSLGANTDYNDGLNGGNHRGFFPFDQGDGTGTKIGYDYGFGMRLDIDFNLTEDGCVYAVDSTGRRVATDIPMKFEFEGDDDVWVFIDGKLALDLGGDHGNAKGSIDFKASTGGTDKGPHATVDYGAVTLTSSPVYGSNEFEAVADKTYYLNDKNVFTFTSDGGSGYSDNSDYIDAEKTKFNVRKNHVLTVFYMERGLVESNLSLKFSVSPMGNRLTVDNAVDVSNVNVNVRGRVEKYMQQDKDQIFLYTVDDTTNNSYIYSKDGEKYTYDADNTPVNHDELIEFIDQIKDDSYVTVVEYPQPCANGNKYSFTTTYGLVDNFASIVGLPSTVVAPNTATNSVENNGRSINFTYKTGVSTTERNKYNDFSVSVLNTIDVGNVIIKKTTDDGVSKDFTFDVDVKLPHEDTFTSYGTLTCTSNGASQKIEALPIGTIVKFTEHDYSDYAPVKKIQEVTVTGTDSTSTVTFENKNIAPPPTFSADITAKKYLDGTASSKQFDFSLSQLKADGSVMGGTVVKTTKNETNGNIKFELTNLESGVFNYLLEETSTTDDKIECDTSKYFVEVDTTGTDVVVKYYKAVKNSSAYTKGDEVTGGVIFNNRTKLGSIVVLKTKEDGATALSGASIALAEDDGTGKPKSTTPLEVKTTGTDGKVTFSDLVPGKYIVYETKSVKDYQLYGEYITVDVGTESPANVTIQNKPSETTLPETGGPGVIVLITIGVCLIAAGIYLLVPSKKKDSK